VWLSLGVTRGTSGVARFNRVVGAGRLVRPQTDPRYPRRHFAGDPDSARNRHERVVVECVEEQVHIAGSETLRCLQW
jgi:hypothetical protein